MILSGVIYIAFILREAVCSYEMLVAICQITCHNPEDNSIVTYMDDLIDVVWIGNWIY
jgi:hypothetical protein